MADPSSVPQKPKPGSLKDRIAAFEKSATAGATTHGLPQPRPKPSFSTWKPKQPSPPPPSPPDTQTEPTHGSASGMSVSDARQSITKGASLKERMAALQNKGAFGAPPPVVAPKPAVERPKWKPPPVVQSEEGDRPSGGTSVIEKSLLSPTRPEQRLEDSVYNDKDPMHETVERPGDDEQAPQDPEEEERQRRAAIAARMARLGGARVGMAPPIIGKKPLVRRPTQEEPKTADDVKLVESSPHPNLQTPADESVPNEPTSNSSELETPKSDSLPSRKNSTTNEGELGHSPKIPTSMPVPAVPRRTGPPRKKPSKPIAAPPEPPEEDLTTSLVVSPESTPADVQCDPEPLVSIASKEVPSTVTGENEVSAGGSKEESSPHPEIEEPEKQEVTLVSPLLPRSPTAVRLPDSPQLDLPSAQTLETSEATDNEISQLSLSPSVSRTEPAIEGVSDVSDVVKSELLEECGGVHERLVSQPNLASIPTSNVEEEEEHSKLVPEDPYGKLEVIESTYKSDKHQPTTQNVSLPSSSTEFKSHEPTDHPRSPYERRSVPPPRRVAPAPARDSDLEGQTDEEGEETLARSHLIVPPPRIHSKPRNTGDEDDSGDGSEGDIPALPVPHRHSADIRLRSIDPLESDSTSDAETDHDGQALPVPLRSVTRTPPTREYLENEESETFIQMDREVMDEDEGDPIDPFHIPSRRASNIDLTHRASSQSIHLSPSAHPPTISRPQSTLQHEQYETSPQGISETEEKETTLEENDTEIRRRTIAERVARLGGITFGAAPVQRSSSLGQEEPTGRASPTDHKSSEPINDVEEEKARKERIAAKIASMGGMRIGMMPTSVVGISTKVSQAEIGPSSFKESRIVPQPLGQIPDTEPETESPMDSEDEVKVEAQESEPEKVDFHDAEPEGPPPIPSRSGRPTRRQSSSGTSNLPASRPPVPATPPRRTSVQVSSPSPQRRGSSHATQSDYVIVDQVRSQETPPRRKSSSFTSAQVGMNEETQESIASQWELPSIPDSTLEFGGSTDLSSSWTDAGESSPPSQPRPQSFRHSHRRQSSSDKSLTAEELVAIWGRVGVQVCEVATSLFDKSKKSLIGDGTYAGFVEAVLTDVPNAAPVSEETGEYGYLVYCQNSGVVQKRASEIMPGDVIEVHDAKFKGHRGLQAYQTIVGGSGEVVVGIVTEFDQKKSKVKVYQANQHVGQQTVESVSYRLEDLKSGVVKIYRVLEAM